MSGASDSSSAPDAPDRLAFFFDAASCSGCKACQVACKDRHGLKTGILWRRVYEISGGSWVRRDDAWIPDVFAYYLSAGCYHCADPACARVCPVSAITRRPDGVVLLDGQRCMGCRYCSWACPYGAPQFDAATGRMTKCTFCVEDLDRGLAPACVSACPMRALDCGPLDALLSRGGTGGAPYPLPSSGMTRPGSVILPHPGAARAEEGEARVGNGEEVGRS